MNWKIGTLTKEEVDSMPVTGYATVERVMHDEDVVVMLVPVTAGCEDGGCDDGSARRVASAIADYLNTSSQQEGQTETPAESGREVGAGDTE